MFDNRLRSCLTGLRAVGAAALLVAAGLLWAVGTVEAQRGVEDTWLPFFASSSGYRPASSQGIFIARAELADLPTSGAGWQHVNEWAQRSARNPDLGDHNDDTDAAVMAKALVYARTGNGQYRAQVVEAIRAAIGTERSGNVLSLARNLAAYVVAADLVGLDGADDVAFRAWLDEVRFHVFNASGPDLSLVSCHERRPNNFGTHCGASRLAAALYLGDEAEVQRTATVFRGWLGDRNAYTGFNFGSDLSWHCDPSRPVGINPQSCLKGERIGGVLPDDQRRAGSYTWPPPKENYVWEALQGAMAQAWILQRQGHDAFGWSDQALLRAVRWLYEEAGFAASGDDTSTVWLVNGVYGTNFAVSRRDPGKNGLGFYDWLMAR